MRHKQLKNKPLVEAILELRWAADTSYKILLGRLFDRLTPRYPYYEQLPTAAIPDDMCWQIVQHRFRHAEGAWPLVQVGPGILTFNSAQDYTWELFKPGADFAVRTLLEAHPKQESLKLSHLVLRYIDAVDVDYLTDDVLEFLRNNMKLQLALPPGLFSEHEIEQRPQSFAWEISFKSIDPLGLVSLRFATGQRNGTPSLVWKRLLPPLVTTFRLCQMPSTHGSPVRTTLSTIAFSS